MAIRKTSSVKGEENPWQALADAIIIQAVKDYRNRTLSELTFQAQRLQRYEEEQVAARGFFCSRWFGTLSDLDGYDLMDRLQKEAM